MNRRDALRVLLGATIVACRPPRVPWRPESALRFIDSRLTPSGDGLAVLTDPRRGRTAAYDAALVALILLRRGRPRDATRVLNAIQARQSPNGAVPFSTSVVGEDGSHRYVRSGAVAWVGYAAAELLDSGASDWGRDRILELAHRAAGYLLDRQVSASDARAGLVTGGDGTYVYSLDRRGVPVERLMDGAVTWASVEHNIDAYFFLRRLARITSSERYSLGAERIRHALVTRCFDQDAGQLVAGVNSEGVDRQLALDCASWGSLFLVAAGDTRAALAARTADSRFAARDRSTGAIGHRPYLRGPVYENRLLESRLAATLPSTRWETLDAVWPEGSAGVAMAALRTNDRARAEAIVDALEALRDAEGALPTFTVDVPFLFDTTPSIAGTTWVELVRYELDRPERPTFWV